MKKTASGGERERESFGKKNTRWVDGRGLRDEGKRDEKRERERERERHREVGYTSFDDAFLFSKQTREERTRAVPFGDRFISRICISARIRIGERE